MKLFNLGKTTIALAGKYCLIPGRPCPVSINLHQNEQTSVEAATLVVSERGGEFWKLATEDPERLVHFQTIQGGFFAFQRSSNCILSLRVSIGFQNPSCLNATSCLSFASFSRGVLSRIVESPSVI